MLQCRKLTTIKPLHLRLPLAGVVLRRHRRCAVFRPSSDTAACDRQSQHCSQRFGADPTRYRSGPEEVYRLIPASHRWQSVKPLREILTVRYTVDRTASAAASLWC